MDHLYIGRGRTETDYMTDLSSISSIEEEVKTKFPEVTEIAFLTPKWMNVVVRGKWTHRSQPIKVMTAVWGAQALHAPKMVILVDEDIDPWDADEVMWAIGARQIKTFTYFREFMLPLTHHRAMRVYPVALESMLPGPCHLIPVTNWYSMLLTGKRPRLGKIELEDGCKEANSNNTVPRLYSSDSLQGGINGITCIIME